MTPANTFLFTQGRVHKSCHKKKLDLIPSGAFPKLRNAPGGGGSNQTLRSVTDLPAGGGG